VLNNKMVSERKGSITKWSWPVLQRTFLQISLEMIVCLQVAIGKCHFQKRKPSAQLTTVEAATDTNVFLSEYIVVAVY
jgi:hypothetical protein